MFRHENSAQGVTKVVGIFELFFDENLARTVADETNCSAQQLRDSRGNIYRRSERMLSQFHVADSTQSTIKHII
jgi:hypothetical protein